jgi:putative hydrolase of the HAD superfamily
MSVLPSLPLDRRFESQTLLVDADDTLWENNIYFEQAISAFISYLDHRVHSADEVRQHLNVCERATIASYGYGLQSFRRSLIRCFEELSDVPVTPERHARIVSFTEAIATNEIKLLPGVEAALQEIGQRHRLILVTKGDTVEQNDKLVRSGLRDYFSGVEVLADKNQGAYREVAVRHNCELNSTWMIGNSPKSDILIPHDFTWVLEHEVVDEPKGGVRLLELGAFSDLLLYF